MTQHEKRSGRKQGALSHALVPLCLGLVACSTARQGAAEQTGQTNDNAAPGDGDGGTTAPGPLDPGPEQPADSPPPACGPTAENARVVLQTYCAGCHGPGSSAKGGFGTILDPEALIASGKIVPDDLESSLLYQKLSTGEMPPAEVDKRPGESDVAALRDWILCGAPLAAPAAEVPYAFGDVDTRLKTMLDDVLASEDPVDRALFRYIDFHNLANAGFSRAQIATYQDAISYLLNSLSKNPVITRPQSLGEDGLIFRIRLSDYGWDAATWSLLTAAYPYGVTYNPNSRQFPLNEPDAAQLRLHTATPIPYVFADWLFSHASRPPLYHGILGLPTTLSALQQQLGVDIKANLTAQSAARAGIAQSDVSNFNRVLEWHALPDDRGALWLAYDFTAGAGTSNVFVHPLDFQHAGNELLFNLPNGMHGYMIVNAAGTRLDKASNSAALDPGSADGAIETGISCMSCHTDAAILPIADQVRASAQSSTQNVAQLDAVLALYVPREEMDSLIRADAARFLDAKEQAEVVSFFNADVHELDDRHRGLMTFEDVAAGLGITSEELTRAIDQAPQSVPAVILALRTQGRSVRREAFEQVFGELLTAIGLGTSLPGK